MVFVNQIFLCANVLEQVPTKRNYEAVKDKSLIVYYRNVGNRDFKPRYQTLGSSGMDAFAIDEVIIPPGEVREVNIGLAFSMPPGYELQIRGRSGLMRQGLLVFGGISTIDSDFRGNISVFLQNTTKTPFKVTKGMRVCQLVFMKYASVSLIEVQQLDPTGRGQGGFGSTGLGFKDQKNKET